MSLRTKQVVLTVALVLLGNFAVGWLVWDLAAGVYLAQKVIDN